MSYIQRAQDFIQTRGSAILRDFQKKTGVVVSGRIKLTGNPQVRYAKVFKDPDAIFSAQSGRPSGPPQYLLWVGEDENDARRMLRASQFALAHEAVEVVYDYFHFTGQPGAVLPERYLNPIDKDSRRCLRELAVDLGAVSFYREPKKRQVMTWSMVGFSKLVIDELEVGRLVGVSVSLLAREMTKLMWTEMNGQLQDRFRFEAKNVFERYGLWIAATLGSRSVEKRDFDRLLDDYLAVFSKIEVKAFD